MFPLTRYGVLFSPNRVFCLALLSF